MSNNIDKLLKGHILVKEIPPSSAKRTWIEVALHEDDVPAYPLGTPPYSMTSMSPYQKKASLESRFQVRISSFDPEEIQQGFDPSYEDVGEYEVINSLQHLMAYLGNQRVTIDEFVESSATEYPL